MSKSIKLTKIYDYPVDKLWKALTSKEALSQWLMPCDFEPIVGHKFQFKTKSYPGFDGITNCEVKELIENKKLSFTWSGGKNMHTLVTFELKDLGGKTELYFEHSGFEGLVNRLIIKRILSNGWKKKILLEFLPAYLEAH